MTLSNGRRTIPPPRTAPANGYRALTATVAGRTRPRPAETLSAEADFSVAEAESQPGEPPAPRRRLTSREWTRLALLLLVLTLLGGVFGYGTARLMPTEYAAHADVLYHLTREQPTGFLREDRNISTQIVLLTSRTVLAPIADEWAMPIDRLTQAVSASVTGESEVISVRLTDSDRLRAQQVLDAITQRYVEVSNNSERSAVQNYLDTELRTVLARINDVLAAEGRRQSEMGPLVDREQSLRGQLDQLQLADLAGPATEILVPAYADDEPASPRPVVTAAAGATAALVVALLALAVVARRMTRRQA